MDETQRMIQFEFNTLQKKNNRKLDIEPPVANENSKKWKEYSDFVFNWIYKFAYVLRR